MELGTDIRFSLLPGGDLSTVNTCTGGERNLMRRFEADIESGTTDRHACHTDVARYTS
jgi:hypothetical protein